MISLWIAIPAWTFATLVMSLWGAVLAAAIGPEQRSLRALTALFLSIFLTDALLLAAGIGGVLRAGPLVAVCVALAVPVAVIFWRARNCIRVEVGKIGRILSSFQQFKLIGLAWMALLLAQVYRVTDQILVLPPFVDDVISYHLTKVAEWIQHGRIFVFDTPVARTFWPSGYELYASWFAVFAHHDFMIEAVGVPFYLLAAGSVYALARTIGASRRAAAWGGLSFTFIPVIALSAVTCSNDLAVAGLYLYVAALLAGPLRGRSIALAGAAMLFGIGVKPTAGFLLPGLGLLALCAMCIQSREGRTLTAPKPLSPIGRLALVCVLFIAFILAGYWYWLSWHVYGNPFYPTDVRIFGRLVFGSGTGGGQQGSFSLHSLATNLRAILTQRIDDHAGHFTSEVSDISGWGWTVFACGWPAAVLAFFRNSRYRLLAAAFAASFLMLFAMVTPDPWNMRFAIWFPSLAAVALAVHWSNPGWRPARTLFGALLGACLILDWVGVLSGGMVWNERISRPLDWDRLRKMPLLERSSAAYGSYALDDFSDALAAIPPGEPLAYHTNAIGWVYMLYGADYSHHLRYIPLQADLNLGEVMRELGIRYMFIRDEHPMVPGRIRQEIARGSIRQIRRCLYERVDPPQSH